MGGIIARSPVPPEGAFVRPRDGCILVERYTQSDGTTGESINFYDTALKIWRQTCVEWRGGAMRFEGKSHRPDGRRVKRKLVFTPLDGGRVRQHSEASTDGGATWLTNDDDTYVKR